MATSVLQPGEEVLQHEPKSDLDSRVSEDERRQILEAKERETGELPQELRERARRELREEPGLRDQALAQLRHFIEKHPAIRKCRTDAPFLLRFLRTKKFSIPQACSMLERYLTIRQMYPQWFQKLDPLDPKIAAVIDAGYLVPLPKRDAEGRRVVLSCMGRFDPHLYDNCVMARVHSMIVELLLDEPRSQLLGYSHVNDEAGMQMPHVSLWSLTDVRIMLNCIQNSTPMRHKRTHFVNIPNYGIKFFEFAVSLLSDKLKDRVMFHRTAEDLTKHVDPAILPKEYGGTVPLKDMIEELKRKLLKHREALLALDDMCIDLYALGKNDLTQDIHSTAGSFRKLELD
ncbi:retinaldehyde-binding protein 1 [Amyelois transitella]|uniref:retinaldehyde-binding protein 1 n=1 Tax=Amyelois transitella TaxID=680683 RepID=UPI00067CB4F0|nr:retinaldehyde-binding protein 1 [Amyelois transitella]XP_013191725.1 retinaldehyde-binding protein 1 [Amyelois transitella]XP_060807192.1 retinaldehyde-binding protein 1 [Amyelois transitella]